MARKDLSRTVIEGGRSYYNSWDRRASHGEERATTREWLDRVRFDHDEADASAPPSRRRVFKSFHDKLSPAHRWLVSQVGRPWNAVYAELCARFDTRTVAGRHVVHDHMLDWVNRKRYPRHYSRHDLFVDEHGILRKPLWFGRSYSKFRREFRAWASGRFCASTSRGWWWFRREGEPGARHYTPLRPLSRGQLAYLEKLPAALRAEVVLSERDLRAPDDR